MVSDELVLERSNVPYNYHDLDAKRGLLHNNTEQPNATVAIMDTPRAFQKELTG